MPLAADDRDQGTVLIGASGTITSPSFTVASPSSPLVVGITSVQVATVANPSWNGQDMGAAVATKSWNAGGTYKLTLFVLKNPTPGTGTITTGISGGIGGEPSTGFYISTTGGDISTGYRTFYTQNETVTGPGLTVADSQSGDLVFHLVVLNALSITFDGSEVVTNTTDPQIGGGSTSGGMSTLAATGANTVVGCTDSANYAEIAFAMPAAVVVVPRVPLRYTLRPQ